MLSGTVGGFKMLNSEKVEQLGPKILNCKTIEQLGSYGNPKMLNSISMSTLALMAIQTCKTLSQ